MMFNLKINQIAVRGGMSLLIIAIIALATLLNPSAALAREATQISIPSINVNAPIVPIYIAAMPDGNVTWDTSGLHMSVGHLEGTASFGTPGNTVLGGHSELARGQADVFYNLDQVSHGDEILVTVGDQVLHYTVIETKTVSQNDLSIIYPTDGERITIMTCDIGSYNASNGTYNNRVVVIAERSG